jgi:hypothetical protein
MTKKNGFVFNIVVGVYRSDILARSRWSRRLARETNYSLGQLFTCFNQTDQENDTVT